MAYGLPSGAQLKTRILNSRPEDLADLRYGLGVRAPDGAERAFLESFRRSHVPSIDAFLGSRLDFMELGKLAIAATLLPLESTELLLDSEPADHWYQYLTEALDAPWEDFQNNRLSVITFNYDRSLEVFLESTLMHRHGRPADEVREKLTCIPILHVYGSLGSTNPSDSNFVPYGAVDRGTIATASANITVIPEGRDNSPEFALAQQLLADADVIGFLGFGFDATNVRRLGGTGIAASGPAFGVNVHARPFKATAFNLTNAERRRAALSITHPQTHGLSPEQHLLDMQCRQMLRETLLF